MWKQTLAVVLLAVSLVACKEEPSGGNTLQITALGDVRLLQTQVVGTGESAPNMGAGNTYYIVAHLELTNSQNTSFTPDPSRFWFTDAFNNRSQGLDQGSSVFIGISNSRQPIKPGEKHDYTIGFRTTDPNPLGTISYEP